MLPVRSSCDLSRRRSRVRVSYIPPLGIRAAVRKGGGLFFSSGKGSCDGPFRVEGRGRFLHRGCRSHPWHRRARAVRFACYGKLLEQERYRIRDFEAALEEECPTLLSFDFIDLADDIAPALRERIREEGVSLYG